MRDAVVIGAGLNGLVAALRLARQKRAVTIVDQLTEVGGGAVTRELAPGFRVPALSHALGPIHPNVARLVGLDKAKLETITPDPALTALGRNGLSLVFHRDPVLTAAAIHRLSAADAAKWRPFLDTAHRVAAIVGELQQREPPAIDASPLRALWPLIGVGWRARGLSARELARLSRWTTMSVADITSEWFESDLLRTAIAARAIFGKFAGPRSAGTGWMLLQRLAEDPIPVGSGVTVHGGPGALTRALADLARSAGVELLLGTPASRVLTRSGRAVGIQLRDGRLIDARAVVAAIDPTRTFDLVDASEVPPTYLERMRHIRARGVMAKVNLALSRLPPIAGLENDPAPLRGRLLIAPDLDHLERAFDAVKYGAVASEPWLEVAVPSVADPSLAPVGHHVMSIYAHCVPRHPRGLSRDEAREALTRGVMRAIEPHMPGLSALVLHREVLMPEDLEDGWGFRGGHIFHGEPTLDQSWIARPQLGWSQYRTPIDGLFLAGAGTHPGGGLTGLSGLLSAKSVERFLRTHKK